MKKHRNLTLGLLALASTLIVQTASAGSSSLVIAELYGAGGNSGATYQSDYVVLYNRGGSDQSISGWSIQYASATGSSWSRTNLPNATIPAGRYYLIKLSTGANGIPLPVTEDFSTTFLSVAATAGKFALVNNTTTLSGTCPTDTSIVDFVGFGTAAICYEGSGPTPAPSTTTCIQRGDNGCTDTDNNSSDFTATASFNFRNSSSPAYVCGSVTKPGILNEPQSRTNNAGTTATFTVKADGGSLVYRWLKNGSDVADANASGAASATLTITNVLAANAGNYQVSITNTAGSTNSQIVSLTVIDPAITTQPTSRTNFTGLTTVFQAFAGGTPTLAYQWYKDNNPLSDTGNVSGSTTNSLTITNLVTGNAGDYFLVVSNNHGMVTSITATLTVILAPSTSLALWNFNDTNAALASPPPISGNGTASLVALTTSATFATGCPDDNIAGATNTGWNTSSYPAADSNNKQAGVQFSVSTAGYKNILLYWQQRQSATASKYTRLQYTTDGSAFTDASVITMPPGGDWQTYSSDLSAVSGINDNTNFAVRIVTEWESTATGGGTNAYVATGSASTYGTAGTIRFDLVNVLADPTNAVVAPLPIPLTIERIGDNTVVSWTNAVFSLASSTSVVVPVTNKVAGATSPYTNALPGDVRFFRLVWP
jgi:hypothetical protein